MAATIIDVAKRCGYSKATVSRAFASPEAVSEKTRSQVYAAARELNYTPNAIARAMVRQRTENIAFIIHEKQSPAILNPFYSPILEAAMREGTKRDYSIFVTTMQDVQLPNGEVYIKKQMDGIILAGEVDLKIVQALRRQNMPIVVLNNHMDEENLFCITVDHYHGARAAAEHLCQRGHRKIGLLAGRFSQQVMDARYKGYCDALEQYGLTPDLRFVQTAEPTLEAAEQTISQLLTLPERPTAFFCMNDTLAAGAAKAILRAGLRIPEDVAIVGFDDSYISRVMEPELTTVRVDVDRMGQLAAQKLFDLIEGKEPAQMQVELPAELIVRRST